MRRTLSMAAGAALAVVTVVVVNATSSGAAGPGFSAKNCPTGLMVTTVDDYDETVADTRTPEQLAGASVATVPGRRAKAHRLAADGADMKVFEFTDAGGTVVGDVRVVKRGAFWRVEVSRACSDVTPSSETP